MLSARYGPFWGAFMLAYFLLLSSWNCAETELLKLCWNHCRKIKVRLKHWSNSACLQFSFLFFLYVWLHDLYCTVDCLICGDLRNYSHDPSFSHKVLDSPWPKSHVSFCVLWLMVLCPVQQHRRRGTHVILQAWYGFFKSNCINYLLFSLERQSTTASATLHGRVLHSCEEERNPCCKGVSACQLGITAPQDCAQGQFVSMQKTCSWHAKSSYMALFGLLKLIHCKPHN